MLTGISHLALSTCDTVVVRDKVRLDVQMCCCPVHRKRLLLTRELERMEVEGEHDTMALVHFLVVVRCTQEVQKMRVMVARAA
jgi:hypothetical protein